MANSVKDLEKAIISLSMELISLKEKVKEAEKQSDQYRNWWLDENKKNKAFEASQKKDVEVIDLGEEEIIEPKNN